jgi:hypothetical protein
MGSLFSSAPKISVPPSLPTTVIDEVNGVEQIPQTNADGSITYITRALPLTPEQQATKDELNRIMKESLAEIDALSATAYTPDAETQKVLDQWQNVQQNTLTETYRDRSTQEESTLAQRGLGDSSAAQEVRRQRLLDQQDAEQNLSLTKAQMAEDTRQTKLAAQTNLYSIASQATDTATARTAQAAARAQSSAAAYNAERNSLLRAYSAASGGSVFGDSFSSSLGSALGKLTIGSAGSLLGSLFSSSQES